MDGMDEAHIPYLQSRDWMYDRVQTGVGGGIKKTFTLGVRAFVAFASRQHAYMSGTQIRCPCASCQNCRFHEASVVSVHLVKKGFVPEYWNWINHGEE